MLTSIMSGKSQNPRRTPQRRRRLQAHDPNALTVKDFSPEETKVSPQPLPVEFTIKVPKRIQILVPIGTSGNKSVDTSTLMAGVPGGLTYWSRVRFERFSVYSDDGATAPTLLQVQISPSSSWNQPPVTFTKSGTVGNIRAAIGFRLGLLDRARYFGTADTTELFVINAADGETVVVQASIELTSPGL
jgi:hypothetical protein